MLDYQHKKRKLTFGIKVGVIEIASDIWGVVRAKNPNNIVS